MQFLKFALAAISVGSAIAAPAVKEARDTTVVKTVLSAVVDVKALVDIELGSIDKVVADVVDDEVLPLVGGALSNIVGEVTGLVNEIVPLVEGLVFPLVDAELSNVGPLLIEVEGLLKDIEVTVTSLLEAVVGGMYSLSVRVFIKRSLT